MMEMTANRVSNHDNSDDSLPVPLTAGWRADALRSSQRPEEFWIGQERKIRARIQSHSVRKPRPLWLAAAAAALLFFAVLLGAPAGSRPPKPATHATIDADQELLLAVERALAAGTPEALEPLTLLVESSANHHEAESISHKEHRREN
jgi:hypothetical protein